MPVVITEINKHKIYVDDQIKQVFEHITNPQYDDDVKCLHYTKLVYGCYNYNFYDRINADAIFSTIIEVKEFYFDKVTEYMNYFIENPAYKFMTSDNILYALFYMKMDKIVFDESNYFLLKDAYDMKLCRGLNNNVMHDYEKNIIKNINFDPSALLTCYMIPMTFEKFNDNIINYISFTGIEKDENLVNDEYFEEDNRLATIIKDNLIKANIEDKKRFIFYITGSYLLTEKNQVIIKITTVESAHTCFNRLDIFNYKTRKESDGSDGAIYLDNEEYAQFLIYKLSKNNFMNQAGGKINKKSYYAKYMKYKNKYMKLK